MAASGGVAANGEKEKKSGKRKLKSKFCDTPANNFCRDVMRDFQKKVISLDHPAKQRTPAGCEDGYLH